MMVSTASMVLSFKNPQNPTFCLKKWELSQSLAQSWHDQLPSVDYTFSSHLGRIRCLTLIVSFSTQHDMQMYPEELLK